MPKTRWDKPKRDLLLEMVVGRKTILHLSEEELAQKVDMSRTTLRSRLSRGSDCWTISEVKAFAKALDIPFEEVRQAIRM